MCVFINRFFKLFSVKENKPISQGILQASRWGLNESFQNWDGYERDEINRDYVIFDYTKQDKKIVRFLVKNDQGKYFLKCVLPNKNEDLLLIDNYPENELRGLDVDKIALKSNIKIFYYLKLKKVLYRDKFDGLVIIKEDLNFVYLFSEKLKSNIPENYIPLRNNWYYYEP
ncbi:hypothetical protein QFZ20_002207 [Flavobacterium sp. W4I14]|nr:hypothetical protein [Flavobacterium sp. W4I14]